MIEDLYSPVDFELLLQEEEEEENNNCKKGSNKGANKSFLYSEETSRKA